MITFNQKERMKGLSEDVWLNEARSEYAVTLCGYDDEYSGSSLERRVAEFLKNPSTSLTEWRNQLDNYGAVNLFMQYFVNRYGQNLLTKIMANDDVGIASIDQALSEVGSPDRFSNIFINWEITNYINDCRFGEGQKFCYLNPALTYSRLHVSPNMANAMPVIEGSSFSYSDKVKDWSAHWYNIFAQGKGLHLLLNLKGEANSNLQIPVILYNSRGPVAIRYLKVISGQNISDLILDFGSQTQNIILIPISTNKKTNFTASEPAYSFSYEAKITSVAQLSSSSSRPNDNSAGQVLAASNYPDGSLIRARGDFKVYIVKGRYKRWIQSPEIFNMYPHFSWQGIIEVSPQERDSYQDAWLIRADGDSRVYEINGDGTKHWLNMTAQYFSTSGRSWDMVYIINKAERDLYRTGADVLR
jgi:hypothetical protein